MKQTYLQSRNRSAGVALVEFVAVAPVIMFLILAVTETGRALIQYNTLTKAVQDGARHAAAFALLGTTGAINIDAQLTTEVGNLVVYGNTQGTGSAVLYGLTTAQIQLTEVSPVEIGVTATYPYQPLIGPTLQTFGLGPGPTTTFNMRAAVNMRAL